MGTCGAMVCFWESVWWFSSAFAYWRGFRIDNPFHASLTLRRYILISTWESSWRMALGGWRNCENLVESSIEFKGYKCLSEVLVVFS